MGTGSGSSGSNRLQVVASSWPTATGHPMGTHTQAGITGSGSGLLVGAWQWLCLDQAASLSDCIAASHAGCARGKRPRGPRQSPSTIHATVSGLLAAARPLRLVGRRIRSAPADQRPSGLGCALDAQAGASATRGGRADTGRVSPFTAVHRGRSVLPSAFMPVQQPEDCGTGSTDRRLSTAAARPGRCDGPSASGQRPRTTSCRCRADPGFPASNALARLTVCCL